MLAKRMNSFSGSPTSELMARIAELKSAGKNIISLNVGEPDFGTPDNVKIAGIKAITDNFTKYTVGNGILELRKAIQKKLADDNGLEYDVSQICTSVGAKQAVINSLLVVCDDGDEVLLPIPCWVSYSEMIKLAGGQPVFVPVHEKGFQLDLEAIKKAITPKTKAIIICTPNNPTGAVYSAENLRALAALACKYDFYIIADEIYEKLVYDGEKHFSVASISRDVWQHCITINGFSKAYAMTGWRLGYVAAPDEIIAGVKAIQSQTTSAASAISQKAAVAALSGPKHELYKMVKEFDVRREYALKRLNGISGISCEISKGAFYLMPDISAYFGKSCGGRQIKNAMDFAAFLLEEAEVALVPGEAFYAPGKVRISYSNSMENLKEALDRIENVLAKLI